MKLTKEMYFLSLKGIYSVVQDKAIINSLNQVIDHIVKERQKKTLLKHRYLTCISLLL
jgi:flagellar biosynthesis regulator FlbT